MRILIAAPLYPPDTAPAAAYTKELATRASKTHDVHLLVYGRLPERIEGVRISTVRKNLFLPIRILWFSMRLLYELAHTDILFAQNGPSVELPLFLVRLLRPVPYVFIVSDTDSHRMARHNRIRSHIEESVARHAIKTIADLPPVRPEILPLEAYPTQKMETYMHAWESHMSTLLTHPAI